MNFTCLHLAHGLQQFSREVALGLAGGKLCFGERFILRAHGESPSVLDR